LAETIYHGKYYVYQWLASDGECLYVGSGQNGRAWHLNDRHPDVIEELKVIRSIRVKILVWVESREEALYYEAWMITALRPRWNRSEPDLERLSVSWMVEYRHPRPQQLPKPLPSLASPVAPKLLPPQPEDLRALYRRSAQAQYSNQIVPGIFKAASGDDPHSRTSLLRDRVALYTKDGVWDGKSLWRKGYTTRLRDDQKALVLGMIGAGVWGKVKIDTSLDFFYEPEYIVSSWRVSVGGEYPRLGQSEVWRIEEAELTRFKNGAQ
jgi:hypothetical protein